MRFPTPSHPRQILLSRAWRPPYQESLFQVNPNCGMGVDHATRTHSFVGTVHSVHCRSLPDGRNNGTATRLRAQATHVRLTTAGTTAGRAADSFCHLLLVRLSQSWKTRPWHLF